MTFNRPKSNFYETIFVMGENLPQMWILSSFFFLSPLARVWKSNKKSYQWNCEVTWAASTYRENLHRLTLRVGDNKRRAACGAATNCKYNRHFIGNLTCGIVRRGGKQWSFWKPTIAGAAWWSEMSHKNTANGHNNKSPTTTNIKQISSAQRSRFRLLNWKFFFSVVNALQPRLVLRMLRP